jgi:hypothetical protein
LFHLIHQLQSQMVSSADSADKESRIPVAAVPPRQR